MVITQLNGGLGNQLFQYAAGKSLADYHGVEYKLDIRLFDNVLSRFYALDVFNIRTKIATKKDLNRFSPENLSSILRWKNKLINEFIPYYRRKIYQEPYFHFDNNFFKAPKNIYLKGYWQSEKYFCSIAPTIIKEFKIISPQNPKNSVLSKRILNTNSVSIHVRRGDYANSPKTCQTHGLCSLDYYTDSIKFIKEKITSPHFYIFSDDIRWARVNLKISDPATFVDNNKEKMAYEDFRLMSQCKHHIIANSSFSWWSSWLSQNVDKIVIAPKQWFKTQEHDTKDLIPEGWLTL